MQQGILCPHVRARHRRRPRLRRALEITAPVEIRPVRCDERDHGGPDQKCNTRRNSRSDAESSGSFENARSLGTGTKFEYRNPKQIRMTEVRDNNKQTKLAVSNILIL